MFGRVQSFMLVAAVLIFALVGWKLSGLLFGASRKLGELANGNPISDAANTVTEAITGDVSLGGWFAEKFSPSVRAANTMLANKKPAPPPVVINENYVGDLPLDTSPGFVSTEGGAAVGILRKMR